MLLLSAYKQLHLQVRRLNARYQIAKAIVRQVSLIFVEQFEKHLSRTISYYPFNAGLFLYMRFGSNAGDTNDSDYIESIGHLQYGLC